ncbi:MAG: GSCFA domain-containing protein [Bacteroidales bacterium]|nr:GSCFA domain-containing protein [Bacteroidales bacterium]
MNTAVEWQTKVAPTPLEHRFNYQTPLLCLGSCFAAEMGARMERYRFPVSVNPFGVLYNPASIAAALERLHSGTPFTPDDLICSQGRYATLWHQYRLAQPNPDHFLESANQSLAQGACLLKEAKGIIVSLGTSWIYRHKERNMIVANCHKLPANQFDRLFLSPQESAALLAPWLEAYPNKQWVITLSPIRHWKEGAHGNQVSKAALLLAMEQLCHQFSNLYYFPAYEIVMDELRDYRFYAPDMIHLSPAAIDYIWEQFCAHAIDSSCYPHIKQAEKRLKQEGHLPI